MGLSVTTFELVRSEAFGDEGLDGQLFELEIPFSYLKILIGNFLYTSLRIELRKVVSKEAVLGEIGALNARLLN